MSDIKARLETIEQKAALCELVGALATDRAVRDANRRLAHDLREEAFMLRKQLANPTGAATSPATSPAPDVLPDETDRA